MQLELRHLEAVCRIAEAGSLGRAAVRLGVSQPHSVVRAIQSEPQPLGLTT
ncbi:LysR family transcriptional regulator, partial [Streptomyces sp. NPDC006324]|uniref:LysR family transcriptional regulator n=1 Tax=Streptomyces sp. NPDC006324 TaxID=3156751 RepID=UPI0033A7ACA1